MLSSFIRSGVVCRCGCTISLWFPSFSEGVHWFSHWCALACAVFLRPGSLALSLLCGSLWRRGLESYTGEQRVSSAELSALWSCLCLPSKLYWIIWWSRWLGLSLVCTPTPSHQLLHMTRWVQMIPHQHAVIIALVLLIHHSSLNNMAHE